MTSDCTSKCQPAVLFTATFITFEMSSSTDVADARNESVAVNRSGLCPSDPYILSEDCIGKGSFGCCYEITNRFYGRRYAGKRLKDGLSEFYTHSKLSHESVVRVVNFVIDFRSSGDNLLVMELCQTDLHQVLNRQLLPFGQIRDLMRQLVLGLKYVHRQGTN